MTFFIVAFLAITAPVGVFSTCPNVPDPMQGFNLTKYLENGTWFETERNYNQYETTMATCIKKDIYKLENPIDGWNIVLNTTFIRNGEQGRLVFKLKVDAGNEAKLTAKPMILFPTQDVIMLDTDYEHYTVVWSCAEFFENHYEEVWIFSLERTLEEEYRTIAHQVLGGIEFDVRELQMVPQDSCDG